MVSSARQAIACILLIFGTAICLQAQTDPAKGPTAVITGKVTLKGKGVSGIVVGLRLADSSTLRTTRYRAVTDQQGNYRIINVPPGSYQVLASAPAFVSADELARPQTLIINKDESVENIDFALVRGGVITGRVSDSEGRSVIEEEVSVLPEEPNNRFYQTTTSVRTDDRGVYRFFGLAPGKYKVAAGHANVAFVRRTFGPSYSLTYHTASEEISQAATIEVTEGSEATNVDITLGRKAVKYSARGRIVDGETGQPLPNVSYGLQYIINEMSGGSTTFGAVSNTEGEFKLENLAPGKYAVFVVPPSGSDWRADQVGFDVIDQDVAGLEVRTSKGGSVSGVIVLEGTVDSVYTKFVKTSQIFAYVMNERSSRHSNQPVAINQDGSFRVGGLGAGLLGFGLTLSSRDRFQIVRVERDGVSHPSGVEIKDREQITGLRIVVNHGNGTIRGVVKIETGTLPQNAVLYVSVRLLGDDGGLFTSRFNESAQVDARGHFLLERLIPGTYEVTAALHMPESRTKLPRISQQVVVAGGAVENITLTLDLNSARERP